VTSKDGMRHAPPNNGMQRTALRTAADAERWAGYSPDPCTPSTYTRREKRRFDPGRSTPKAM
jgi:hypothetical protein